MTEFTQGIHGAARKIYENNKGSLLRTLVYTIGHFINSNNCFNASSRCFFYDCFNRCYCGTIS